VSFTSTDGIWNRKSRGNRHTMSERAYVASIATFTAAGVILAALLSQASADWTFTNMWLLLGFILGVFAVSCVGAWLVEHSDSPFVSAVGYYGLISAPFGLLIGPVVALYTPASVARVLAVTVVVVIIMGVIGALVPKSLESWLGWLVGGTAVLVVGFFAFPLLGAFGVDIGGALRLWDWVGVVLFCGWVIYDLNRAMRLNRTLNNAVDCSAAVFLDIANMFLLLLRATGQRRS